MVGSYCINGSVQFIFVESCFEISKLIACWNSLFLSSCFDFSWKCKQNVDVLSALCWQIWYPQKLEFGQYFYLEIHVQIGMSQHLTDSYKWELKI